MKICLEGWSKINHSFSISCVNKLLEFIKLPIDIKFKETSYSNNRKYLDPSLESLVENTSLIIQNPRKYGNEKSIKFIRDNFSWKKTVEKIYNIFDKNL